MGSFVLHASAIRVACAKTPCASTDCGIIFIRTHTHTYTKTNINRFSLVHIFFFPKKEEPTRAVIARPYSARTHLSPRHAQRPPGRKANWYSRARPRAYEPELGVRARARARTRLVTPSRP